MSTMRAAVITVMHSAENEPLAIRVQKAANAERKGCLDLAFSISFKCEPRHPDGPPLEPGGNCFSLLSTSAEEKFNCPGM